MKRLGLLLMVLVIFLVSACIPTPSPSPTPKPPTRTPVPPTPTPPQWRMGRIKWLRKNHRWFLQFNFIQKGHPTVSLSSYGMRIRNDMETIFDCDLWTGSVIQCTTVHPVVPPLPEYQPGHSIWVILWYVMGGEKQEAGPWKVTLPAYPEVPPTLTATLSLPTQTLTATVKIWPTPEPKNPAKPTKTPVPVVPNTPTPSLTPTLAPTLAPTETPTPEPTETATQKPPPERDPENDVWWCSREGYPDCGPFQNPNNPCPDYGGYPPSTAFQLIYCGWIAEKTWCVKAYK